MPYIKQEYRELIEKQLDEIFQKVMRVPSEDRAGILTYVIYKLFLDLRVNRYADFAVLMGILDCVGKEFYRRVIAPHEDEAAQRNGDVK
jgi:hypothetical protein